MTGEEERKGKQNQGTEGQRQRKKKREKGQERERGKQRKSHKKVRKRERKQAIDCPSASGQREYEYARATARELESSGILGKGSLK